MSHSIRQPLLALLCLGLAATASGSSGGTADASWTQPGSAATSASRPNLLLIMLDDATEKMIDWRLPDGSWVMPNAQALKGDSSVYENTYVDIPSCCPSRVSTFTGRYPHNTTIKHQGDGVRLPIKQTFAHRLQRAGYATAMAGRFLVPWPIASAPPSFDRYSMVPEGYYDPVINRNGVVEVVPGYSTNLLADDLREYLGEFEPHTMRGPGMRTGHRLLSTLPAAGSPSRPRRPSTRISMSAYVPNRSSSTARTNPSTSGTPRSTRSTTRRSAPASSRR